MMIACEEMDELCGFSKRDLYSLKSLTRPPQSAFVVLGAIACLLEEPTRYWKVMQKMMCNNFLERLAAFERDNVTLEVLVQLQWYLNHPLFQRDVVRKASLCCDPLQRWVTGISSYALLAMQVQR